MKRSWWLLILLPLYVTLPNGSSAGWTHGTPFPLEPYPAQAWGYSNLTFYENWASTGTIDLSNTMASGFNWYINNAFPNAVVGSTNFGNILTAAATQSGDLSVSSNQMAISTDRSNIAESLNTCVWNGSALIGTTFTGGFYIDVPMKFDPTAGQTGFNAWPIFWFAPKEFLNGSITNTNFAEIDGFEGIPTSSGGGTTACATDCDDRMSDHDWNSNGTDNLYNPTISSALLSSFGTWTYNAVHHIGLLWVPTTRNSGTGIISRYVDGVQVSSLTYSSSTGTNPALSPSNPNGALFEMESENFCLLLGTGHDQTTTFGPIQVWQHP